MAEPVHRAEVVEGVGGENGGEVELDVALGAGVVEVAEDAEMDAVGHHSPCRWCTVEIGLHLVVGAAATAGGPIEVARFDDDGWRVEAVPADVGDAVRAIC